MVYVIVIENEEGINEDDCWVSSTMLGRWSDKKRRCIIDELLRLHHLMNRIANKNFTHASIGVVKEQGIVR